MSRKRQLPKRVYERRGSLVFFKGEFRRQKDIYKMDCCQHLSYSQVVTRIKDNRCIEAPSEDQLLKASEAKDTGEYQPAAMPLNEAARLFGSLR